MSPTEHPPCKVLVAHARRHGSTGDALPAGDHRGWEVIDAWAHQIATVLQTSQARPTVDTP